MTVLVSVKIKEGVAMAADNVSSYANGMIYNNSRKIVNLRQGLPVGPHGDRCPRNRQRAGRFDEFAIKQGLSGPHAADLREKLVPNLYELLFIAAMPMRGAIDLARYSVETAIGFVRYSVV